MVELTWQDAKEPAEEYKTSPVLLAYREPGDMQDTVREASWDPYRGCWLLSAGNVIVPLERANFITGLPAAPE